MRFHMIKKAVTACLCVVGVISITHATLPVVAVHDSELTRALETMPATSSTPTGPGTTGNQWWPTNWHYFVMPDSVKETLRSDGTAYTVIGDSNIVAGVLTNSDGSPRYPIVISLASEAIQDAEIAGLTNYVAAGGFLFVGSSSFTRNTNGTTRGDFAIANAMGVHMTNPALANWTSNNTFSKVLNHSLVAQIPGGVLNWQMPLSSEDISWPYPAHLTQTPPDQVPFNLAHWIWLVQTGDASVIAQGDGGMPYLLVKQYGKGYFIYDAAMQPLIGHGSWSPGMYAYGILRNAINWAFQSANVPVVKVSPWPYPYDAAVVFRHDEEAIPADIDLIEGSAQFENASGAKGDYFFCTGALREDYGLTQQTNELASLQRAVSLYGATIGSHNGGLTNINTYVPPLDIVENLFASDPNWYTSFYPFAGDDPPFQPNDYDYWHWGPDEILDTTNLPPGFTNGAQYAFVSISNSFSDIANWGLTNSSGFRTWVSPYFNATRERSYQIEEQLGIKATGDDKLTPFPHWVFSTQTPDKYYSFISLPVSDWFIGNNVAQSMEDGYNIINVHLMVNYYYSLGALINLYSHSSSAGAGLAGPQESECVTYSLSKPRMWAANAEAVYNWWLQRSNVQITASFSTNGYQSITTVSISGAGSTNAAVELLAPSASFSTPQISTNGVPAGASIYRTNGQVIKIMVGASVTNAVISYTLLPNVQNDFYTAQAGTTLTVSTPGVLTNSAVGADGGSLTAILVDSVTRPTTVSLAWTVSLTRAAVGYLLPAWRQSLSW
jgi:hypothetical protein